MEQGEPPRETKSCTTRDQVYRRGKKTDENNRIRQSRSLVKTEQRSLIWQTYGSIHNFNSNLFLDQSMMCYLHQQTCKWKLTETPDCPLCAARGTQQHILSSCAIAISQGRYTWRHNNVLRELAYVIEKQRREVRTLKKKPIQIQFVKEEET